MKRCDLQSFALLYIKEFFPDYIYRFDKIWNSVGNIYENRDNIDQKVKPETNSFLNFAKDANSEIKEVISGLVAIRIIYEREQGSDEIPFNRLQLLISQACEQLKVSPEVKVKLEKITINFDENNSGNSQQELMSSLGQIDNSQVENHLKNIESQIDDSSYRITRKIDTIARQRKESRQYATSYEVILRKISCSECEFEVDLKVISVTPTQFNFLLALANQLISDIDKHSSEQGWLHYDDIIDNMPDWNENTQYPQIRTQVNQLRNKLDAMQLNKWLIQNDNRGKYRLSTHPENVILE